MSNISEIPEIMRFLELIQNTQTIYKDKPGYALDLLNIALEDAVKKSVQYKQKSSLTLKIDLIPSQMNQLEINTSIKLNEPKPEPLTYRGYTDSQARLFMEDPNQLKLIPTEIVNRKVK